MPAPTAPSAKTILILGGTAMGRDLYETILANHNNLQVFYSVKNSAAQHRTIGGASAGEALRGKIISGGFAQYDGQGRSESGFINFCQQHQIKAVVVAVSPFATTMAATAAIAAKKLSLPIFYYQPPPWHFPAGANITTASSVAGLVESYLQNPAPLAATSNILLALGAKDGQEFLARLAAESTSSLWASATPPRIFWRTIYPPTIPPTWSRGWPLEIIIAMPQDKKTEKEFLRTHRITLLVGKNSGGDGNETKPNKKNKFLAALELSIPILSLTPPPPADGKNFFTTRDKLLSALNKAL